MNNKKDWIKLDNAATIYPATITRKYAPMFRLTITLKDQIDKCVLQEALNKVIKRFPTFSYSLKQGFFWCYFNKIMKDPKIYDDAVNPMIRKSFDKNFMYRVRVYRNRIAVEYFHALTDGTGGLTFLLTLTAEYIRLKYKVIIPCGKMILNLSDEPTEDEISDSFLKFAKSSGSLVHEKSAYHIKGTNEKDNIINIITGIVETDKLKDLSKKYNATITEFLVSLLILSIKEMIGNTNKEIKVSIPINLRNIYPTNTLRNFSSYVNVGVIGNKDYSLKEIVYAIKKQLKNNTTETKLNHKISGNVKLMKNSFIRRIPMFIKKHIMSFIEYKMGDGYITTTLSNLGLVNIPNEMKEYVSDMNFILGKSRGKSTAIALISYNNKTYITFSRKIKESEFERLFFTNLVKIGLEVEIESNR